MNTIKRISWLVGLVALVLVLAGFVLRTRPMQS